MRINNIKQCKNNCIFCFVRQQPSSLRDSLRIFDDDYSLSFIKGNYITLTNLTPSDWFRIYHWKLSPLYISVHTTNSELRVKMLRNIKAKNILKNLENLQKHNIKFHTQIVLCPDWNDKQELNRTIEDLGRFYPHILSIAVVPVGLTKYRDNLMKIPPVTEDRAANIIKQVEKWQKQFIKKIGFPLVYLADEFYLKARQNFPSYRHYGDFCQLENGVGIVVQFIKNWQRIEKSLHKEILKPKTISIACGLSAVHVIEPVVDRLNKIKNLKVVLKPIKSIFWGDQITVSGLVTGTDIINALTKTASPPFPSPARDISLSCRRRRGQGEEGVKGGFRRIFEISGRKKYRR